MTKRVAGFALFCVVLGLIAACGGSALSESGAAGSGNLSGQASVSGAAGTSSAGSVSAGGANAAGAVSAGGSDAVTGGKCSLPFAAGNCDVAFPAFWHDPNSGLCVPVTYNGCGGNENRFPTREACLAACATGSDWSACKHDTDCIVTPASCCGCEPLSDGDLLALNGAFEDQEKNTRCATEGACAPCMQLADTQKTGKYFEPVCAAGHCSALDIRESPITECKTSDDCMLRAGVACCSACGDSFVSVNKNTNFCPDGSLPCPKCVSIQPKNVIAQCDNGRCVSDELLP